MGQLGWISISILVILSMAMRIHLHSVLQGSQQIAACEALKFDAIGRVLDIAKTLIRHCGLEAILVVGNDRGASGMGLLLTDAAGFPDIAARRHHKELTAQVEVSIEGR
ncbi:MAG: hypothetical protein GY809_02115 [Planctomycetes bacterium]|nr:hypothetical protein [Planctomycetota bacterium]